MPLTVRRMARIVDRLRCFTSPHASKQLDLNKRDWIDVRITPIDRALQDRSRVEQPVLIA